MTMVSFLIFLHLAAAVVWVGGMFFAYVCLRPAAVEVLEPPARLTLWRRVFDRFFVYVWVAVVLLPLTGTALLWTMNWAMPVYVMVMATLGIVMIAVYVDVALLRFAALKRAVDAKDWPAGGAALGQIRQRVGFNLALGGIVIATAVLGRGA
jgi:uncharacterized membrane protein